MSQMFQCSQGVISEIYRFKIANLRICRGLGGVGLSAIMVSVAPITISAKS
jgi:hypothetical protein